MTHSFLILLILLPQIIQLWIVYRYKSILKGQRIFLRRGFDFARPVTRHYARDGGRGGVRLDGCVTEHPPAVTSLHGGEECWSSLRVFIRFCRSSTAISPRGTCSWTTTSCARSLTSVCPDSRTGMERWSRQDMAETRCR